jgi:hypothetical protein
MTPEIPIKTWLRVVDCVWDQTWNLIFWLESRWFSVFPACPVFYKLALFPAITDHLQSAVDHLQ